MIETTDFASEYYRLLGRLLVSPLREVNKRTGVEISMLRGGTSFKLDLSNGLLPTPGLRRVYPKTAAAEVAWFLLAEQSVKWLETYAKIWSKFVEADGETVQASYGYRWRRHFGRDQILEAIGALSANNTDRRVFVSAWDPAQDGLGVPAQKNVPCPVGFTFSITADELHSTLLIRSSDVFVGLPYDVMGHAMLMEVITSSIRVLSGRKIKLGTMQVSIAHPHLYSVHYGMAQESRCSPCLQPEVQLQAYSVWDVEAKPEAFVQDYADASQGKTWPSYNPRPELVL